VEHEKKTFFSWLKNTRSGGISQGRVSAAQRAKRSEEPLRMPERRVQRVSAKKHDSPRLSTKNHD
jgi:hypothetical protein